MEFLGITSSQNVEQLFEQNDLKNIFQATFKDKIPIRIGYILLITYLFLVSWRYKWIIHTLMKHLKCSTWILSPQILSRI